MEHVAILNKRLKLLDKIISGEKTIESRWYKTKKTPYKNISAGENVFFKDSGKQITVKSKVDKVLFFEGLTKKKTLKLLQLYGKKIGVDESYANNIIGKNVCTLIFLKNVEKIEPFGINKKGYGNMAAWITLDSIERIKKSHL